MRGLSALAMVATIVAAVLLAACGGGGRLSEGSLRHDVAAICRPAHARVARITVPVLSNARGAADALDRAIAIGRHAVSDLRALNPPKPVATRVDVWTAALDQMLDEITSAERSLRAHDDLDAHDVLARAQVLDARARQLSEELGIRACLLLPRLPQ